MMKDYHDNQIPLGACLYLTNCQSTWNRDHSHSSSSSTSPSYHNPIKCRFLLITLLTIVILSTVANINTKAEGYYSTSDRQMTSEMLEDYGDTLAKLFLAKKRSCIRRGAICDLRPNDCCGSSLCKCNLWGTNCRCQRLGLFQRWG